ncbi:MAG: CBS domain-containing protein [Mangrovicoccus sp.]
MPTSYVGRLASTESDRTYSQTSASNLASGSAMATVATILEEKGGTVYSIAPQSSIAEAVHELHARRIGVLTVMDGNELVGIISERDIVRHLSEKGAAVLEAKVVDLMTATPITCTPSDPLLSILKRMSDGRFRHMPAVENGQVLGLISIGDVVKHRLRELEYEALRMKQMIVG